MRKRSWIIPVLLLVITACTPQAAPLEMEAAPTATSTLPGPRVHVTPAPDVDSAVAGFMGAWQDENYAAMYALLATATQGTINETDFTARYRDASAALTLQLEDGIAFEILQSVTNPDVAVATINVNYNTYLFGILNRQVELNFIREADGWRLQWEPTMILPELQGGNTLEIVRQYFTDLSVQTFTHPYHQPPEPPTFEWLNQEFGQFLDF